MGYADQIADLAAIRDSVDALARWLSGENDGTFPPDSYVTAISGRVRRIRAELDQYLYEIDALMSMPMPFDPFTWVSIRQGTDQPSSIYQKRTLYVHSSIPPSKKPKPKAGGEISVAVYADGSDDANTRLLAAVDNLVAALGYDGPSDVTTETGSIFRRSVAKAQQALSSDALEQRLHKVERALEIEYLDLKQAEVDGREAEAIATLIAALNNVPRGCARAGSILLIKYPVNGEPAIFTRNLSQLELRALEQYPEIQTRPETALQALAMALENLQQPAIQPPPQA